MARDNQDTQSELARLRADNEALKADKERSRLERENQALRASSPSRTKPKTCKVKVTASYQVGHDGVLALGHTGRKAILFKREPTVIEVTCEDELFDAVELDPHGHPVLDTWGQEIAIGRRHKKLSDLSKLRLNPYLNVEVIDGKENVVESQTIEQLNAPAEERASA